MNGCDLVVVNFRTHADLGLFLASLDRSPPSVPWTLTIVNVAPRGEDRAVARAHAALRGHIDVVTFEDNVGYARAANRGASGGTHSTVAVFNADVEITPGALDACVDALWSRADWGVLGPRQVDHSGRMTAAGIFGPPESPRHRGWHQADQPAFADIRDDALYVSGSAYFMRRSLWDELTACARYRAVAPDAEGPLLPTPLFYEENYASRHAAAHGWKNVYYGPARMIHGWHRSVRSNGAEAYAQQCMRDARRMYRQACDAHGIAHE